MAVMSAAQRLVALREMVKACPSEAGPVMHCTSRCTGLPTQRSEMPRGSDPTSVIPRPSGGLTGASEARLASGLRPLNSFPWSVPVPTTISGRVLRGVRTVTRLPIIAVPINRSSGAIAPPSPHELRRTTEVRAVPSSIGRGSRLPALATSCSAPRRSRQRMPEAGPDASASGPVTSPARPTIARATAPARVGACERCTDGLGPTSERSASIPGQ